MMRKNLGLLALSLALGIPLACSAAPPSGTDAGDGDGDSPDDGTINLGDGDGDGGLNVQDAPPTANCGDGMLTSDEACDDGNLDAGDGCGDNCRYIEPGWVCPSEGEPCRRFAKCGDGVLVFPEQCDDGNLTPDDGCSATCKIEVGFKCEGDPSACSPTVCGDGNLEGAETCEDGNNLPFDGCSADCQGEPICSASGCTSSCGDGLVIAPEECDDGNAIDGDGCSSSCVQEEGYDCSQSARCPDGSEDCPLELPVVFRDFNVSHPDFYPAGQDCGNHAPGIASATLDENGKPTLAGTPQNACTSAETFPQWYGAAPGDYAEILGSILLYPNGSGGFVNRYGPDGEQYPGAVILNNARWCGPAEVECMPSPGAPHYFDGCGFDPAVDTCFTTSSPGGIPNGCASPSCAVEYEQPYFDGNPLYFPIDDHPDALADTRLAAKIPAEYYQANGWPWEDPSCDDAEPTCEDSDILHNFHFTSEVTYWFEYQAGTEATFLFIGDDDVFVYLNNQLVLDLGGIHVPLAGTFTLGADGSVSVEGWTPGDGPNAADQDLKNVGTPTTADALGLVDGNVYEIKVFHAERKPEGSSFMLTLSGFDTARSECTAICGDGILAAGEQCDNGAELNTGGHNGCNADCTLGAYCGDGIVQEESEQCDDADPNAPNNCSGCRILVVR